MAGKVGDKKPEQKYKFYFFVFFGGLVAGKIGDKQTEKYKFYFFKTYMFWRAGGGENWRQKTGTKI